MRQKYFDEYDRNSRLYCIWRHMKERCNNPNHVAFQHYGGRGITVCEQWKNDFLGFKEWALQNGYSAELTIDRIDNNGGYTPNNCRWATREQQQNNRRTNHLLTFLGETHSIAEWGRLTGISRITIRSRIREGWSTEEALTIPVRKSVRIAQENISKN